MSDLDSEQLQFIQQLLIDPLRETIRTEMRLNHDQMIDVLNGLEEAILIQAESSQNRLASIEADLSRLKSFRRKLVAIYSTLTVVISLLWSIFREKVMAKLL